MITILQQFKNQMMLTAMIVLSLLLMTPNAEAKPADYNGGVNNEYDYEEVFFLTGYPVKFSGKVTATEREGKGILTSTYKVTLKSAAGDTLVRNAVYVADLNVREDKGQTTAQTSVKSFSEKVTIGTTTYTLADYQFSQGAVSDNRPASDYYSGNIVGRKIYNVTFKDRNKKPEEITVHISGRNMGYENFWGATETQIMDNEIVTQTGSGLVTSKVSDSKSKILQYEPHNPSLSSFTGGYAVISSSNMISEYTYNLPYGAGKGEIKLSKKNVPKIERLIVPKFRDLSSHWAKDNIERLYSLGVFDEQSQFFSPNTPMQRYQYTIGVLKAADIRVLEAPKKNSKAPTKAIFQDLNPRDKNYPYIESAVAKGIVNGVTPDRFDPDGSITRAQAVAILMRAIGMEGRAPTPGYKTNYADNDKIPNWARDSVYMATELGFVTGDNFNRFNANAPLTRAQASALLVRFLDFLENDLKQNYRDDVLFFE